MHEIITSILLAALMAGGLPAAQAPPPDTELVLGVRQVKEGDFEAAVVTLQGVVKRLQGQPTRSRDLLEAYIHLGVAEVALDQRDAAKGHFRQALALNEQLRLGPERFSPKVLGIFEEARAEAQRETITPARKRGLRAGPLVLASVVGGAAVAGVVLATRGDGATGGTVRFLNARFGTPVIVCPDGSDNRPIAFTILLEGANDTTEAMSITSVSSTMIIVSSPGFPEEVNFSSSHPTQVTPRVLSARSTTTLTVESTLLCGNAPGDSGRVNEWSGRTLATPADVTMLETVDRLRVNIP